jgi:hypothetical protein
VVQGYDAGLQSISGLTEVADQMIYTTGNNTYALTTLTTFGRSLIDDANSTTARETLGLVIGTNVQAWDAQLDDVAGLTPTDGNFIVGNGTNWISESGNTARTSLGLGTADSPQFTSLTLTSDLTVDTDTLIVSSTTGRVGVGTTDPQKKLDVNGDIGIASGSDLYIGTIGLNDNTSVSSGASLIGLYDDSMTYVTANTTVQNAIKQLDSAIFTASTNDISQVGDGTTGAVFTADGEGNTLWFEGSTADEFEILLTGAEATGSDKTITLPNVTGTVALGTGTQNFGTRWTSTNTLGVGQVYDNGTLVGIGSTAPTELFNVGPNNEFTVTSAGAITGTTINTGNGAYEIQDATTLLKGLASFNSTNFSVTGGAVSIATGGVGSTELASSGVSANTYGNSTNIPQITVDEDGRITSASNILVSYENPLTFSNGLTRNVNAVTLGGSLTQSTRLYDGTYEYLYMDNGTGNVGIGTTGPAQKLSVGGSVYTTGGMYIGANNSNNLIDDSSTGAGSSTLYIGNESILASGDIGVSVQGYDAGLQSISGLTEVADQMIYTTGNNTYALTTLTTFGRSLIDDANSTAARTTLGLVIGTNVQAWDAQLDDVAGLTPTDGNFIVGNGTNWVSESGNTARTSLGLGTGDSPQFTGLTVSGLTTDGPVYTSAGVLNSEQYLNVTRGGTGAGSFTSGGILLGSGTGAIQATAQPTNGQLLIGSTGLTPVLGTLTGTSNQITVTNGAGTITLSTPQDIATTSSPTFDSLILTNDLTVDTDTLIVSSTSGRVGVGTTDPQRKLDVNGDIGIASGSDLYIGTIGLNDNTSVSSGASLIGLYDDSMTYVTANTTVQNAIKQLDSAIFTASTNDISQVGDGTTGAVFTADGEGNTLWFEGSTADEFEILLTGAEATGSDKTITLPNVTGTVALGTGTQNFGTRWTSTNTLGVGQVYDNGTLVGIGSTAPTELFNVGPNNEFTVTSAGAITGTTINTGNGAYEIQDATTLLKGLASFNSTNFSVTGGAVSIATGGVGSTELASSGVSANTYGNSTNIPQITVDEDGRITSASNILVSYENPLTFSNGLTRNVNAVTLGGSLTQSTRLYDGTYEYLYMDNGTGNVGIGTTGPAQKLSVGGSVYTTGGMYIGANNSNNLIDDSSTGAGSSTLYIGNESILASGDIGVSVQGYDAGLQSISGLTEVADQMIYTTGNNTYALTTLTTFGRSLIDDANSTAARTTLGLVIGTNVQAWDAQLDDVAGLTPTDGNFIVGNGTNWVSESGNTARTSLGLGTGDSPQFTGLTVSGLTTDGPVYTSAGVLNSEQYLNVTRGGTGAGSFTSGGILLGSGTGAIQATAQPTNGQLLIGSTGLTPVLGTLTGTSNQITVTNGAGTITLSTPQDIATTSSPTFLTLNTGQGANELYAMNQNVRTSDTVTFSSQIVTNDLRVDSDTFYVASGTNRVGIGNTDPQFTLDVTGDIAITSGSDLYLNNIGLNDNDTVSSGASLIGLFDDNMTSISGNTTVQNAIKQLDSAVGGSILAIGDVTSGEAFTALGNQGTSLWFYDSDGRGQLTIDDLSQARTYNLPDASGTIALGTGAAGYVPYWSSANNLTYDNNGSFYWDATNNYLGIGTTGPAQELEVVGDILLSGGVYVGTNNTNNLISSSSTGSGSNTLYIGNESILASGDVGSIVQAYNAGLQSISGLTESADQMLYTTGDNTYTLTSLTAFGRSLIDDANNTAARTTLGLVIGTNVQAWDLQLDDIAGLTPSDGNFIVGNGSNFVSESGNVARTSLGVGTSDSPSFTGLTLSGLTTDGPIYASSGVLSSEQYLSVNRGGTGVNGSTVTAGQLLIGNDTSNGFTLGTLTGGDGIAITNTDGGIEIDIDLLTSADGTGVAFSNSGLELSGGSSDKISLLQGCAADEILKWDDTNNQWECAEDAGSGTGSSKWTEDTNTLYPNTNAMDLALGVSSDTLVAPFSVDISANLLRIGDGVNDANTPSIKFYASDATNDGTISFNDSDEFEFIGGNVNLGAGILGAGLTDCDGLSQKLQWDSTLNEFVCGEDQGSGSGGSKWTDGTTATYLSNTSEDLTVGAGDTLVAPFSIDVSANVIRIGDGTNDTNDPTINFYSSNATDSGALSYTDNDEFKFSGGNMLLTNNLVFEGATDDAYETIITVTDPTDSDKTITFPNETGTVTLGTGTGNFIARWTGANSIGTGIIYDNNTNVGIGTTSPAVKLDVAGSIRAWDGSQLQFGGSNNYLEGSETSDYLGFGTNGSEKVRILSSGNVGIGTTNPVEKLQVLGNIRVGDNNSVIFSGSSGQQSSIRTSGTSDLTFRINGNDYAIFDSTGRLGIGTTAPSDTLHVEGNIYSTLGLHIGMDSDNNLVSTSSTGAGSTTLYIGNESIITSGDIGSSVQGWDEGLDDISGLSPLDGNFIVGNGTEWIAESGATARSSLGLGAADSPSFTGLTLSGLVNHGPVYVNNGTLSSEQYLSVTRGGTGTGSLTSGGIVLGNGTGAVQVTARPNDGQILIGSTGVNPVLGTLTGTSNQVNIANGAGSITLSLPQDIATTSAPTFATLNTGQGANELYAMNQNVRTSDSVAFSSQTITNNLTVDTDTLYVANVLDRVGVGTTNPQYKLDVEGDIRVTSGNDYYHGTVGFNDNVSASSGASLIGLFDDDMDYVSGNTSVQDAIKQLDTALQTAGGDIFAVGDVLSGDAFTSSGSQGTSLWFYDADGRGQLTIADLTQARTFTLPNTSGSFVLENVSAAQNFVPRWSDANGNLLAKGQIYDNGTLVGIGSTAPTELFNVGPNNEFTVTSAGAITGTTINTGNGAYEIQDATTLLKGLASFNSTNFSVTGGAVSIATGGVGSTELASSGVSANTYGNSTNIPQITVDEDGRITSASNILVSYENPLTFSNGLTRNVNAVTLGGSLTQSTRLYDGTYEYLYMDNGTGNVGIGTTGPAQKLSVGGSVYTTGGMYIGANNSNNLIDDSSTGAGSSTLYIGNESILASGDIGVSVQGYDAGLQSISGLTEVADQMIYTTGDNTYALTTLTSFGRSLIDDANSTAARTTLGLVIGTNVQAWDAQLDDVAGLTPTDGNFIVGNGTNWVSESGNTARTSLGLGTGDSPQFTGLTVSGLTDGIVKSTSGVLSGGNSVNLGTEVTGTLDETNGGTGINAYTTGDMLYASAANTLSRRAIGTNGYILSSDGTAPQWTDPATLFGTTYFKQGGNSFSEAGTLGTNDNYPLYIETNNTTALTIDTSQQVGIGTTAPAATLDVTGTGRFTGALTASTINTGNGAYEIQDATTLLKGLASFNSTNFSVTGGAVSIATGGVGATELASSGVSANTYGNSTNIPQITVDEDGRITSASNILVSYENPLTFSNGLTRNVNAVTLGGSLTQSTRLYDGTYEYLYMDNGTGNVGIGTTGPAQKLSVGGSVYTTGGMYIGANNSNNLIDDSSTGAGSSTLYIGNESILASGDIGVSVQGYDAGLQSISGLTEVADQMIYTTGDNTYALTTLTSFGRSLIDDANSTAARTTLGLVIGTNVQAWDAQLDDVAGLTPTDGNFIVGNGTNWVSESGNTARTSLGLGTGDSPQFTSLTLTSDLTVDSDTLIVSSTTGRVGVGTTDPQRKLDVNGDIGIASGSDLYIGTIGLNDNTSVSSGASLIGLYDDSMTYVTANTTVQNAIKQLDSAIFTASTNDISQVGDGTTGAVFTADGEGNTLWFEGSTADEFEILLTGAEATGSDKTITLPNVTGTVALGTGTQNFGTRWTSTNTLGVGQVYDNGTLVGIGSTAPTELFNVGPNNEFTVTSAGAITGTTINTGNGAYEIQDATTLLKGLASFNSTNFSVTGGAVSIATGGVGSTELASSGVSANTYGNSTNIPQITVDEDGRITSASNILVSYENPLTFSNGLTRNVNAVTLGGSLTQSTRLYDGTYEYLYMDNGTGNVGIGTTGPAQKLSVGGSVYTTGGMYIGANNSNNLIDDSSTGAGSSTLYIGNESILASGDIGVSVQGYDAGLQSISGLTEVADQMIYTTGNNTYALTTLTTFGRSLIDDANSTTARETLGLVIGTNVQAWDAQLDDVAGLTPTDGNFIVGNGTNWISESGNTARTSLGLGTADSPQFTSLTLTSDLTVDTDTLIVSSTTGRVGVGTTDPQKKLDVNGDIGIASGSDLYIGTIGLNDNTSVSSGASLIGLYDDSMTYVTANTTVQNAIKQLDSAIFTASTNDISQVGDGTTGAVFTADGEGNTLWFEGSTADEFEILLTGAEATGSDKTITLPNVTGTVALGTGTQNFGTRWTSTNTLGVGQVYDNGTLVGIGSTAPTELFNVGPNNEFTVTSAGAITGTTINTGNGAYEIQDATTLLKGLASFNSTNFSVTGGAVSIATGGVGSTELASSGVSANTYGNSTNIPQITVDEDGRITSASNILVSYENPLTFSNGLTRNVNAVTLGGSLTQSTRLYDGTYEYLYMDNGTGNVGIGTTGPAQKLSVGGSVYTTGGMYIGANNSNNLIDDSSTGAGSSTLYIGNESILASGDIGVSVQGYDAGLQSISGLTEVADQMIYTTGNNTYALTTLTTFGRSLIDDANSTAARTTLGLVIGTNVQAWDAQLDDVAGLTPTDGNFIVGNGTNWVSESGNTARTSLGLGTGDSPQFTGLTVSGLTDGIVKSTSGVLSGGNSVNLGTEVTGTLDETNGGTGINAYTTGDMLYASAANTLSRRAIGTNGYILSSDGTAPQWTDPATLFGTTYFKQGGNSFSEAGTLGTNDNYPLYIETNNTTALTIDTSQQVGIGTTAPAATLDVTGTGRFTGALTASTINTGNGAYEIQDATTLLKGLASFNSTNFSVTGGAVSIATGGVGATELASSGVSANTYGNSTNIPQITVDEDGRITSASNILVSYENPLTFSNGLTRNVNAVTLGGPLTQNTSIDIFGGGASRNLRITNSNSGNEILFVDGGNDYIGIGNTAPGYKLDVTGDIRVNSGSDYYVGTIGMNDNSSLSSGASLVGLYDDSMTNISANTNVQSAIKQLDTAINALGDITAIGDVTSGAGFTSSGTQGTSLYFYDADGRGQLTRADLTQARTYTLPDATGTVALGTGTAGYAAYWSASNNLSAEQYLNVTRGGTGTGSFTSGGIVLGNGTGALQVTGQPTDGQLLIGSTGGNPVLGNLLGTSNQINVSSNPGSITLSLPQDIASTSAPTFATINTGQGAYELYAMNQNVRTTDAVQFNDVLFTPKSSATGAEGRVYFDTDDKNLYVYDGTQWTDLTQQDTDTVLTESQVEAYVYDSDNSLDTVGSNWVVGVGGQEARINLNGSGDFVIQDNGVTYATFDDAGVFTMDSLRFDGTNIGLTSDTDLLALNNGSLTINGNLSVTGTIGANTDETINGIDINAGTISDVVNLTINTGGDLTVGTVGLNDPGTSNANSGASLVGVYAGNFEIATSSNLQLVLEELDAEISDISHSPVSAVDNGFDYISLNALTQTLTFNAVDLSADVTGTLPAANGGTGLNTSASTGVPTINSGTWSVQSQLSPLYGGTGDNTSATTGVPYITTGNWLYESQLSVARGGTGASTLTSNGVLYGNGTGTVQATSQGTDGAVLYSNAGTPAWLAQSSINAGQIDGLDSTQFLRSDMNDSFTNGTLTFSTGTELDVAAGATFDLNGSWYRGGTLVNTTGPELNILNGATITTTELNLLDNRTGTLLDSNNVGSYATTAVTAGNGLTGGGTVGNLTLTANTGNGLTITADAITVNLATSGATTLDSSFSGLESDADGLSLLSGCQSNEVLLWTGTLWECTDPTVFGSITAVGDVTSGAAFTATGTQGSSLWFYDSTGGQRGQLTIPDLTVDRTYTLPNASGTLALGAGTSGYATYWSSANTIGSEQYLNVTRGGTGFGSATSGGIVLGNGTSALQVTAQPTNGQLLIGSTGNTPVLGSLTGTTNQVTVTPGAGTITLSTPQDIATTSAVTFATLNTGQGDNELYAMNQNVRTTDSPSFNNLTLTADLTVDTNTLYVDSTDNFVGIGTTNPTYTLDVNGNIRAASGNDFYLGTIGFNDNTTVSSGSSLIGVYDDAMTYVTGNTTVQSAIKQLDTALTTNSHSPVTLNTTTYDYLSLTGQQINLLQIDASTDIGGVLPAANGGTGLNTSASNGVATVTAGTWSIQSALSPLYGGTGDNTSATTGVPYINAGNWSYASQLGMSYGGTNKNLTATEGALVYSDADSLELLGPGNSGYILQSFGSSAPQWVDPTTVFTDKYVAIDSSATAGYIGATGSDGVLRTDSSLSYTDGGDYITLGHADTSSQASQNNSGTTVIQDLTLDTYGHLTGAVAVDLSTVLDNYQSWTIRDGDTDTYTITSADTLQIAEGTAIDVNFTGDDVLTITNTGVTSLAGTTNQINVSGSTGAVTLTTPQDIATTSAVTFASLNTGHGANELYAMNQNVQTSNSPSFVGLTLSGLSDGVVYTTSGVLGTETDLSVVRGGTGLASLTDGGILLGSGTGDVTVTARPTNGQLLIGSTGSDPVLATLTAGTGIGIGNASGAITITNSDLGSSQYIFKNVAVSGQSDVVADSNNDTLTLVGGTNISLSTNAGADSVTINATAYSANNGLTLNGTTYELGGTLNRETSINTAGNNLIVNVSSNTEDFLIQDNGVTYATFTDTGEFILDNLQLNGNNIGLITDNDLIVLADNAVTLNGSLSATGTISANTNETINGIDISAGTVSDVVNLTINSGGTLTVGTTALNETNSNDSGTELIGAYTGGFINLTPVANDLQSVLEEIDSISHSP